MTLYAVILYIMIHTNINGDEMNDFILERGIERYYDSKKFPAIFPKFLDDGICDYLSDYLINNQKLFTLENPEIEYWKDRTINYYELSEYKIRDILRDNTKRLQDIITEKASLTVRKAYPDTMVLTKWTEGIEQLPHADRSHLDGTENYTPWRDYSTLIYLNESFEGGDIFFPRQKIFYKPKKGTAILFPATTEFVHGVSKIKSGVRFTLTSFWSFDKGHSVDEAFL